MAAFFCLINLKAPQKILECVILNLPAGRRVYFQNLILLINKSL